MTACKLNAFPATYTLDFSGQILVSSVAATDLQINGQPATGVRVVDGDTFEFDVDPATNAGDGTYTVTLAAGAVTDLAGRGNEAFSGTFVLDTTGPTILGTTWNGARCRPTRSCRRGRWTSRRRSTNGCSCCAVRGGA